MTQSMLIPILLIVAVAMIGLFLRGRGQAAPAWPQIGGTVAQVEYGENDIGNGPTQYYPMMTIAYQVGGVDYRAARVPVATMSSYDRVALQEAVRQKYPEGGTVALAYDPEAPQRVRLI